MCDYLEMASLPIPARLNLLASELRWLRTEAAMAHITFIDVTERSDVMETCADLADEVLILASRPAPAFPETTKPGGRF